MALTNPILTRIRGNLLGLDAVGRLWSGGGGRITNGGDPKAVPHLAYANAAASTAVTATSSETAFDTKYTIPKNSLRAGELIKVKFQGIATATNSTDTLQIKLYIGGLSGTALLTGTATDVTNNNIFHGEYEIIVRTIGSSGTIVGMGWHKAVPAAEATITVVDDILASTTLDTTADKDIVASATWSTNNAGNSCRMDFFRVERW